MQRAGGTGNTAGWWDRQCSGLVGQAMQRAGETGNAAGWWDRQCSGLVGREFLLRAVQVAASLNGGTQA